MNAVSKERISNWWHAGRLISRAEKIADAVVHSIGLVIAVIAGTVLVTIAAVRTAPEQVPALFIYVMSFIAVLGVSMAFNLWPRTFVKQVLARFDQAAIFLFIAGTYTPFLALVWQTPKGLGLTIFVWSAALVGVALKLLVPRRFGRLAILLYLGIGWSGVLIFKNLAETLPSAALWLLLAGGITYSLGIIFHLWEKLKFYTALWHSFVVVGASLHLIAIFEAMVFSRW